MKEVYYEICKRTCAFYKPIRKTEEHCYGFDKLVDLIEAKKISLIDISNIDIKSSTHSTDKILYDTLCIKCPFLKDGCDFRAGKGNEPCGGYKIFDILISGGSISKELLK